MNNEYRIENDSLGDVYVPKNALFGAQTQRAIENFQISGRMPNPIFVKSMVLIKKCAAVVNSSLGYLNREFREAIVGAANQVLAGEYADDFRVDPFQAGAGTSHNMNVNEVLANLATLSLDGELGEYLIHPNDHVNMAQSTNDTIPTAIRLGVLLLSDDLFESVEDVAISFENKSIEFDSIVKSGRTHMQDAVPVRLGQEFSAYGLTIRKDFDRLVNAVDKLLVLGIGGTATGSGLNAAPEYRHLMIKELSQLIDKPLKASDNLFESMQSQADLLEFSSAMRTLSISMTRIANDLRLLSSGPGTGFAEIKLPAVQPGSSIMPGKVNPVMIEMLNMSLYHVIGCDQAVALAVGAGQFELNVMMPLMAHELFEMMQILTNSLNAFNNKCLKDIEANSVMTTFWLERNAVIATVFNPIVGYAKVAELVKIAVESQVSIKEVFINATQSGDLLNIRTGENLNSKQVEDVLSSVIDMTNGGVLS